MISLLEPDDPTRFMPGIADLRSEYFYNDPLDHRYWHGGLHLLVREHELLRRHNDDPYSRFLVGVGEGGQVLAYARYSLGGHADDWSDGKASPGRAAITHVLVAHKSIRGLEETWVLRDGAQRVGRAGDILYQTIFERSAGDHCDAVFAEVYIAPCPNLVSFRLHRRLGFEAYGKPPRSVMRPHAGRDVQVLYLTLRHALLSR